MEVPAWVSNTQKVEKAIADLNEAGKHVRGEEGRDGLLHAYAEGRKVLPQHKTKADYASFVEADVSFKKIHTASMQRVLWPLQCEES